MPRSAEAERGMSEVGQNHRFECRPLLLVYSDEQP